MPSVANALCFGEDLPGAGTPCFVEVSSTGISVQVTHSSATAWKGDTVLFTVLSVSAGGIDHDHLVVKWVSGVEARTLYLRNPALIVAFRNSAPPELTADVERTAQQVRRARHSRRTFIGAMAGLLAGLLLLFWLGSDVLVALAVNQIPVEWEQKLGEAAQRDFLSSQTVVREGTAVQAVQEITGRLTDKIENNPYKFQVTVVQSDVVNAFALPGGYVVVFTGLLKKAESPEEVAGVLGHELNHVLQRHGLERIVKTLGIMAVVTVLIGDQQGLIGLAEELGVELVTLKFSRGQETQADLTGLRLLHRAKISPDGMIKFFERLSESEGGRVELISTHPMSTGRAERLRAEAASLPRSAVEPFSFSWDKVQESLGAREPAKP